MTLKYLAPITSEEVSGVSTTRGRTVFDTGPCVHVTVHPTGAAKV